jgi:signal transduction histidine kinase
MVVTVELERFETERQKLADELHDEFAPRLFGARMKFASLELTRPEDIALQEQSLVHIDDLIVRVRKFTTDLMPNVLFGKGLVPAIREFFETINSSKLELNFCPPLLPELDQRTTVHIYKILHEIVYNTIKHSGAKSLVIEFHIFDSKIGISTGDDGVGFNYKESLNYGNGHGLKNIINRVELLSGDIHVSSTKHKGTSFYISFPFKIS